MLSLLSLICSQSLATTFWFPIVFKDHIPFHGLAVVAWMLLLIIFHYLKLLLINIFVIKEKTLQLEFIVCLFDCLVTLKFCDTFSTPRMY